MRVCPRSAAPLAGEPRDLPIGEAAAWSCSNCRQTPASSAERPILAPTVAGGFDPASFDMLSDAEEGSFWFRQRNALITETLGRYAGVGLGPGDRLRQQLRAPGGQGPVPVVGAELHPEGLAYARRRLPGVPLLQLDARDLPFREEFQAIGAFDVIEHIDDDRSALASMYAALPPRGTLLVTVPQHPWLWSHTDEAAHHERRYTRRLLRRRLTDAGFEILLTTSFVSTLLPLMAASRILKRTRSGPYDEMKEHRAAGRAARAAADGRASVDPARRPPPGGGSLLAVAQACLAAPDSRWGGVPLHHDQVDDRPAARTAGAAAGTPGGGTPCTYSSHSFRR